MIPVEKNNHKSPKIKKTNLAVAEEVQDRTEVLGVTIYQERPTLILNENMTMT